MLEEVGASKEAAPDHEATPPRYWDAVQEAGQDEDAAFASAP